VSGRPERRFDEVFHDTPNIFKKIGYTSLLLKAVGALAHWRIRLLSGVLDSWRWRFGLLEFAI
jgi:hypothetical protein